MQYLTVHGNKIAYQQSQGEGTPAFWCGGFKSDMTGTKAESLAQSGIPFTRFDYSGHGVSEGDFREGCISRWLDEAEAVYRATCDNALIIGSSMGGWIALLLAARVKAHALLLIAPAPDFTEKLMWESFSNEIRHEIMEKGEWIRPSPYDATGYPITKLLIEDGRKNLILNAPFSTGCPVHIVTGGCDEDVPVSHVLELIECLPSNDVRFTLVKDGDHRLSRDADIALILKITRELLKA
jgi:pimeloyl-ACP methyl ester carboxylesterase